MSAKITAALHAVMSDVAYVQRNSRNDFHNYSYASEADLLDKLRPSMLKHGLILIPSVAEVTPVDAHGNTTVRMEYTLAHKDGDVWPHKIGAAGTGNDRAKNGNVGDKGTYKAITGANKYLLFKLFQIETGDDPEIEQPPAKDEGPTESEAFIAKSLKSAIGLAASPAELEKWKRDPENVKLFGMLPPTMRADVQATATAHLKSLQEHEPVLMAG